AQFHVLLSTLFSATPGRAGAALDFCSRRIPKFRRPDSTSLRRLSWLGQAEKLLTVGGGHGQLADLAVAGQVRINLPEALRQVGALLHRVGLVEDGLEAEAEIARSKIARHQDRARRRQGGRSTQRENGRGRVRGDAEA